MNELRCKYQYITPTTLHISADIATSRLYASSAEGFNAQIANLVEVYLVEIYRCKLCQFTSSLKNKIRIHVSDVHQLDQIHLNPGDLEIGTDQEENDSYSIGEDIAQENKENEENLDKMPFLLPMYRMLNTVSPESCDMSLGDHSSSTNVTNTCELFEEESSQFQLDESVPGDSIPLSGTGNSPTSRKSKDEEDAQCEHLLSLGLCRISSTSTHPLAAKTKAPKTEVGKESSKSPSKVPKDTEPACLLIDRVKRDVHKQRYLCATCQLDLKTKETYRIHMRCHEGDEGFRCFYCGCHMAEWGQMEKHIQTHKLVRNRYQCPVCEKRFMTQKAWKAHKRGHDGKSDVFYCTKCPSSFETERVRNLHLACHHEDTFKCWQCGSVDKAWSKIYEHLCAHDSSLKPYICNTCNQTFCKHTQLKAHTAKHKKHRSVTCPLCDQTFKNSCQMSRHQKRFHHKQIIGEGRKRKRKKAEDHIGLTEPEGSTKPRKNAKREFACDICSRKCSSKLALQRHMGVHAGVKPFHCQHCEYRTRLKASLVQHMRIHTGEINVNKYSSCQNAENH
ncbi:hypothetical protein FKM82_006457 [Ascaphus truei]